jgi:hypothetical protein
MAHIGNHPDPAVIVPPPVQSHLDCVSALKTSDHRQRQCSPCSGHQVPLCDPWALNNELLSFFLFLLIFSCSRRPWPRPSSDHRRPQYGCQVAQCHTAPQAPVCTFTLFRKPRSQHAVKSCQIQSPQPCMPALAPHTLPPPCASPSTPP